MFLPAGPSGMADSTANEKTMAGGVTMVVPLTTILQPCLGVVEMMLMPSAFGYVPPPSNNKERRNKPVHDHSTTARHTNCSIAAATAGDGASVVGSAERMTIISVVLVAGSDSDTGGDSDSPRPSARLAMLTSCGRAMVVEIEGVCEAQGCVGVWTVLADWSTAEIQGLGPDGAQQVQLPAFLLPRRDKDSELTQQHQQQPFSQPPPPLSLSPCSSSNNHRLASGRSSSSLLKSTQMIASKYQVLFIVPRVPLYPITLAQVPSLPSVSQIHFTHLLSLLCHFLRHWNSARVMRGWAGWLFPAPLPQTSPLC